MKIKIKTAAPYVFWGVTTAILNYIVFGLCYYGPWHFHALLSNVLAFAVATTTAFLANKLLVFRSRDWSWHCLRREAIGFLGVRVLTFAIEEAGLWVASALKLERFCLLELGSIRADGILLSKVALTVLAAVINYLLCACAIFQARQQAQ